jgi:L-rhamnose mutarotase
LFGYSDTFDENPSIRYSMMYLLDFESEIQQELKIEINARSRKNTANTYSVYLDYETNHVYAVFTNNDLKSLWIVEALVNENKTFTIINTIRPTVISSRKISNFGVTKMLGLSQNKETLYVHATYNTDVVLAINLKNEIIDTYQVSNTFFSVSLGTFNNTMFYHGTYFQNFYLFSNIELENIGAIQLVRLVDSYIVQFNSRASVTGTQKSIVMEKESYGSKDKKIPNSYIYGVSRFPYQLDAFQAIYNLDPLFVNMCLNDTYYSNSTLTLPLVEGVSHYNSVEAYKGSRIAGTLRLSIDEESGLAIFSGIPIRDGTNIYHFIINTEMTSSRDPFPNNAQLPVHVITQQCVRGCKYCQDADTCLECQNEFVLIHGGCIHDWFQELLTIPIIISVISYIILFAQLRYKAPSHLANGFLWHYQ